MVEPFVIYTFPLSGGGTLGDGVIGMSRLPGRSGDLAGDVAVIRDWGASLVVSMTEAEEMAAKGGAGLPAALASAGIVWEAFPIRDFGAPQAVEIRWPPLVKRLHAVLDGGGRVLLHCAGGCGRSGMVAMRLLVERGMVPDAALAFLRATRPCAVETPEQAVWAGAAGL